MQGVVPGAVRGVPFQRQGCHPLLADRDAGRVVAGVQGRLNPQPAAGPGRRDRLDDHLMAGQRPAPPVQGDVREQPVLDLVPLGGARREVADRDRQPRLGGQGGQLALPDPVPVAVGAARVRGDQQAGGLRVVPAAAHLPPAADGLHGEDGRVVIDTDIHPAGVAGDVVDPVRDRLLHIRAGEEEAVVLHLHRLALRAPLPAAHRQPAQLLPLLGVHADHRLAGRLVVLGLLVDVPELRIPVRMLVPLQRLGVALQAEAILPQQAADRGRRHRMPLPGQLAGQVPQRLGRPPQRRFRVAALVRLHQRQQGRHQTRIQRRSALAAPAPAPHPPLGERLLPSSSSKTPARTVVSLTPATRATARTPPCPSSRASVASSNRRCRSFRCGISTSNRSDS